MKKIFLLIITFMLVLTLSACDKGYTNIDNEQLQEMLDDSDNYQFIDVRTSTEFYDERIPGFNYNIDYYILEDNHSLLDNYDLDKNLPVVIMCNSGNRSVDASIIFHDQGFEEVYNLTDGIQGWNGETE